MKFTAQPLSQLQAGAGFVRPPQPPRIVHIDDSALDVMTDFNIVHPVTVSPDTPIDVALETMKTAGVRLLLVVDENEHLIGLVTANDIQGEQPIELAQTQRLQRSEISVKMIMTPQSHIQALDIERAREIKVGHVAETLRRIERRHILVVNNEASGKQTVCGLFSLSQIEKQLRPSDKLALPDHPPTVAELVHELS